MMWKRSGPGHYANAFRDQQQGIRQSDFSDRRSVANAWRDIARCETTNHGSGFFAELKRRNIGRVAILYLLVCWLIYEPIYAILSDSIVGEEVEHLVYRLMVCGFPVVIACAWLYELTPAGLRRTAHIDRRRSIMRQTAVKLDCAIVAVIALQLAFVVVDNFWLVPYVLKTHAAVHVRQQVDRQDATAFAAGTAQPSTLLAAGKPTQ